MDVVKKKWSDFLSCGHSCTLRVIWMGSIPVTPLFEILFVLRELGFVSRCSSGETGDSHSDDNEKRSCPSQFSHEDGGSTLLRNNCTYIQIYIAPYSARLESTGRAKSPCAPVKEWWCTVLGLGKSFIEIPCQVILVDLQVKSLPRMSRMYVVPHEGGKFQALLTSTEDKFAGHFQDPENVSGNINVT
jgi:hypothetical protein